MSLTLQESAALVGGHCWIERRLFERLGAWSQSAEAPAATLLFDGHAQHAAWRAQQWWDRLPVLAQIDREELVTGPAGWREVLDGDREPATTVERVGLVYRALLPRLATRYSRHADQATPMADGPALRTLGHVAPDVTADRAAGQRLLEELLVGRGAIESVAAVIATADIEFLS